MHVKRQAAALPRFRSLYSKWLLLVLFPLIGCAWLQWLWANEDHHILQSFLATTHEETANATTSIAVVTLFSKQDPKRITKVQREVVACSAQRKRQYAQRHGYFYLDDQSFDTTKAIHFLPHHTARKQGRYQKLQFLLQICETRPDIEWILWLDADAVVTDLETKVEDRLSHFQRLFDNEKTKHNNNNNTSSSSSSKSVLSMVVAQDLKSYNTGVFLLRNNQMGRRILLESFQAPVDARVSWADQAGFLKVMSNNNTEKGIPMKDHVLVLNETEAHMLQSYRVRNHKAVNWNHPLYWQKHHWVLHMPGSDWEYRLRQLNMKQLCVKGSSTASDSS